MKNSVKIVLIEDNQFYAETIIAGLEQHPGYHVTHYTGGKELQNLKKGDVDVFILDFFLGSPDDNHEDGEAILDDVMQSFPEVPVIMLTVMKDIDKAIGLLKKGASDYIVKDEYALENLLKTLEKIELVNTYRDEIRELKLKIKRYRKRISLIVGGVMIATLILIKMFFF